MQQICNIVLGTRIMQDQPKKIEDQGEQSELNTNIFKTCNRAYTFLYLAATTFLLISRKLQILDF